MLVMNSTLLRDVLLIWMPYLSINSLFLKVSPSMPVAADRQGGTRRVDGELVGAPRDLEVVPAGLDVVVVVDA